MQRMVESYAPDSLKKVVQKKKFIYNYRGYLLFPPVNYVNNEKKSIRNSGGEVPKKIIKSVAFSVKSSVEHEKGRADRIAVGRERLFGFSSDECDRASRPLSVYRTSLTRRESTDALTYCYPFHACVFISPYAHSRIKCDTFNKFVCGWALYITLLEKKQNIILKHEIFGDFPNDFKSGMTCPPPDRLQFSKIHSAYFPTFRHKKIAQSSFLSLLLLAFDSEAIPLTLFCAPTSAICQL